LVRGANQLVEGGHANPVFRVICPMQTSQPAAVADLRNH
jgi:hypothetical protein